MDICMARIPITDQSLDLHRLRQVWSSRQLRVRFCVIEGFLFTPRQDETERFPPKKGMSNPAISAEL
eukprot:1862280-Amphidinium_carterae.1